MRTDKLVARSLLFSFVLLAAAACQGEVPGPTAVTAATLTPFPTSVPLTNTPIPTPTTTLRPSSTPLPTLTLAPSLTPVPTRTPTPGLIGIGLDTGPFRDDFSDPLSGWPVQTGGDWGFGYFEGGYRIYSNIGYAEIFATRTRSHTDFIIQVDAQQLSGADDAYFGIMCRSTIAYHYTLGINGNGEYMILRTTGDERPELLASGPHDAIRTGGQTNRLLASCIGNRFTLLVNGVEVVSVLNVGPLFGSFVGLIVGTYGNPEIAVKFDNFDSYPTGNAPPIPTLTPTGTLTITPTATETP